MLSNYDPQVILRNTYCRPSQIEDNVIRIRVNTARTKQLLSYLVFLFLI